MNRVARSLAAGVAATLSLSLLTACGSSTGSASSDGPVYFGVSGPVSGPYAYIGKYWKKGFDLAVEQVNKDGGIDGRPLKLIWEDSQSEARQSVPIAQKFVGDDRIIAEIGDFASPASMAASSVYQRAGLVQYAFTASSVDFTKGGDHMFAPQSSQLTLATEQAKIVSRLGKSAAVLYLETDWGKSTFKVFQEEAKRLGLDIPYSASYLPTSTDHRPILLKARDADPDVIVQLGYDDDGAAILRQIDTLGIKKPKFFSSGLTQAGIDLAGKAANGAYFSTEWYPEASNETVRTFVAGWRERHDSDPSLFEAGAYDAVMQLATAAESGGATREGVFKALQEKKLPSVRYGDFTFQDDRRPPAVKPFLITVVDGRQTLADGVK